MTEEGGKTGLWMCVTCGLTWDVTNSPVASVSEGGVSRKWTDDERDRYAQNKAELCCQEKRCAGCGVGLGKKNSQGGMENCDACRSKEYQRRVLVGLKNSKRLTVEEFGRSKYEPNMLNEPDSDIWHANIDDAFESFEERSDDPEFAPPCVLVCSEPVDTEFDLTGRLKDFLHDNCGEDSGDHIPKSEYERMEKAFREIYDPVRPKAYEPCGVIVVLNQERFDREIATVE